MNDTNNTIAGVSKESAIALLQEFTMKQTLAIGTIAAILARNMESACPKAREVADDRMDEVETLHRLIARLIEHIVHS